MSQTSPTAQPQDSSPFARLAGQRQVASFLTQAVQTRQISHAYMFTGPIGSSKTDTAIALAKAVLCKDGGCGSCDDCIRVSRRSHPDFHIVEPEGASSYLIEQIHELIHDAALAPMRSRRKVYLLTRADMLRGAAANALLKTLEEPPASVVFILLARTLESVMETIVSRCQVVAFRYIPEVEAIQALIDQTGTTEKEARIALAASGGSLTGAREYLGSNARRDLRLKVLGAIEGLPDGDELDALQAARELTVLLSAPLDELIIEQERQLAEGADFLSKGALTALEQRQKRVRTARERERIAETLNVLRSWLRDVLLAGIGRGDDIVNSDFSYNISRCAAHSDAAGLARALLATDAAQERIAYNVSVQSTLESLLLSMQRELKPELKQPSR
ncbi:MAG: DNA polymerase III subunit delta' [Coriobacteriales bacterium]|jgi:DNA polymerase-3 subunit delta'|nr:DNA polymerase III subunit delta' [Coriobacteriales bacterium]